MDDSKIRQGPASRRPNPLKNENGLPSRGPEFIFFQNLPEAAMWFEKAAAAGVPQAMLNLGKMLEQVNLG